MSVMGSLLINGFVRQKVAMNRGGQVGDFRQHLAPQGGWWWPPVDTLQEEPAALAALLFALSGNSLVTAVVFLQALVNGRVRGRVSQAHSPSATCHPHRTPTCTLLPSWNRESNGKVPLEASQRVQATEKSS